MKKGLYVLALSALLSEYGYSTDKREVESQFYASRSYFYTLETITRQLLEDINNTFATPTSTLLTSYTQSPNLPDEFEQLAMFKILKDLQKTRLSIVKCLQCLQIQGTLEGNDFVIKKGVTSDDEMRALLKKHSQTSYTEINVSQLGANLILIFAVHDSQTKKNLFVKEYSSPFYSIKDAGLNFALTLGAMQMKGADLLGGRVGLGQRIADFGDVGMWGSSFTSKQTKAITGLGLYFDLDLNDISGKYWIFGSLLITTGFGLSINKTTTQSTAALGIKLKVGSVLHLRTDYMVFRKLKLKEDKTATDEAPEETPSVDLNKNLPNAVFIGFGLDLGA